MGLKLPEDPSEELIGAPGVALMLVVLVVLGLGLAAVLQWSDDRKDLHQLRQRCGAGERDLMR